MLLVFVCVCVCVNDDAKVQATIQDEPHTKNESFNLSVTH